MSVLMLMSSSAPLMSIKSIKLRIVISQAKLTKMSVYGGKCLQQMHLWAEVARTIVYVQNRISHSALGFKTLE